MNAKERARELLEAVRADVVSLSHRIHGQPELAFEEERACAWLSESLADAGINVEAGVAGLPTAFAASVGTGPLHLGLCAEYDALPGVGHACGHNIIGAAAIGAARALAPLVDDLGITLTILGTPAEENGGGKIIMIERGSFAGLHAAMMVHPAPSDTVDPVMLAVSQLEVRYRGKEAHAAMFPEKGINAADALTVAQVAVGLLRQHLRPGDKVHGITTHAGEAANIIPAEARASYMVRAPTLAGLGTVTEQVQRCFDAGALATGATVQVAEAHPPYAEVLHHLDLAGFYRRNSAALGRTYPEPVTGPRVIGGSTDMGNVSQIIPTLHPFVSIDSLPAVNHQPEFADHCVSPAADRALFDGALAMAWTAIDAATDPDLRETLMRGSAAAP